MTRRRLLTAAPLAASLATLAVVVSSCGAVLDIHDVPTPSDGGDDTATTTVDPEAAKPFLGVWNAATVVSDVDCNGNDTSSDVHDTLTIELGTTSTLVVSNGECTVRANVTGTTAFVLPNETCTRANGDTLSFDGLKPIDNSYDLDSSRLVLHASYLGDAQIASQPDATCVWSLTGDYAKKR